MPFKDTQQQKDYQAAHYQANIEKYKAASRLSRDQKRAALRTLKDVPCADCGESHDPSVMDFHHNEDEHKVHNVSWLLVNRGWKTVLDEVAKCVVLCANCHRYRHIHRGTETRTLSTPLQTENAT